MNTGHPRKRTRIACIKCRSLKHKCDFLFPHCTRCYRAGIVCLVQDPITKEVKKRLEYKTPNISDGKLNGERKTGDIDHRVELQLPDDINVQDEIQLKAQIKKLEDQIVNLQSMLAPQKPKDGPRNVSEKFNVHDMKFGVSLADVSLSTLDSRFLDATNTPLLNQEPTVDIYTVLQNLQKLPKLPVLHQMIDDYYKFSWPQNPIIPKHYCLYEKASYISKKLNENPNMRDADIVTYIQFLVTISDPYSLFVLYTIIAIASCSFSVPPHIDPHSYYITSTGFLNIFLRARPQTCTEMQLDNLRLKKLQALLLIVVFGLMKPIKPGIWFIINHCSLMVLEMDLYLENVLQNLENMYIDKPVSPNKSDFSHTIDLEDLDSSNYNHLHRFLFWITFSFERQIASYVDKPTIISEIAITSEKIITQRHNDPDYLISNYFIELRTFQGKILLPTNTELNPLTYIPLKSYIYCLHSNLNKLLWSYIDMTGLTKDNSLRAKLFYVNDFFILNYYFILQQLYKPSTLKHKLIEKELELLFNCSFQIISIYENLVKNNRINFAYLSVNSIRLASLNFFYSLMNSEILYKYEKINLVIDTLSFKLNYVFKSLQSLCPPSVRIHQNLLNILKNVKTVTNKRRSNVIMDSACLNDPIKHPQTIVENIIDPVDYTETLAPGYTHRNDSDTISGGLGHDNCNIDTGSKRFASGLQLTGFRGDENPEINYSEFFSNAFGNEFMHELHQYTQTVTATDTPYTNGYGQALSNMKDVQSNYLSANKEETGSNYNYHTQTKGPADINPSISGAENAVLKLDSNIDDSRIDALWEKLFLKSSDMKSAMM